MLNIETIYKRGILFVKLYGVINKKNTYKLDDILKSAILKVGIKYLLVNFDNVYYLGGDAFKIISKWNDKLKQMGGKIFICGDKKIKDIVIGFDLDVDTIKDEISAFNMIRI